MNKKLKSMLCGAVAFVAGSVGLSACSVNVNVNDNNQQEGQVSTETGISYIALNNAKATVLNALAIDGVNDNRDLFMKWGNFSCDYSDTWTTYDSAVNALQNGSHESHLKAESQSGAFSKVFSKDKHFNAQNNAYFLEEYLDFNSQKKWTLEEDQSVTESESGDATVNYNGANYPVQLNVFDDYSFASVYKNNVKKEVIDGGYTLTLDTDWVRNKDQLPTALVMKSSFVVKITFNNANQITGMKINFNYGATGIQYGNSGEGYTFTSVVFECAKSTEAIAEPTWVTAYNQN